ncbi:MAG: sulfite exporter TauE/SafE family protein [Thermoplasmata archaeon]|nr:sulfite exporter TauE/SafE family protein [Thermoplasmata archaeon]
MDLPTFNVPIAVLAFFAAILNGAIGYGFSSTVTPIALFFTTNKVLNPALVLVELAVNATLLVRERKIFRAMWPRAWPVIGGLLPGVIAGSILLNVLASTSVRLIVYAALLPLIVLQLLGVARPLRRERQTGPFVGTGIGFLYSLTTISGPPLALFWRNQGLSKDQFRCVMAQVRTAEASFTAVSYLSLGYFTPSASALIPSLLIPVLIGVPLGTLLLTRFSRDFFRAVVMEADGVIVAYGLNSVLIKLKLMTVAVADTLTIAVVVVLGALLYRNLRSLPGIMAVHDAPKPHAAGWSADAVAGSVPSSPLDRS